MRLGLALSLVVASVILCGCPVAPYDQLMWGAPLENPTAVFEYDVYRSTGTAAPVVIATTKARSYKDHAITKGVAYHYKVTAKNVNGVEGPPTPTLTVTAK